MKRRYSGVYSYQKDIGKVRKVNEDESLVLVNSSGDVLMMVCDGHGGEEKGEFASKEVINFIANEFKNKNGFFTIFEALFWVQNVVEKANKHIYLTAVSEEKYKGMGTTLSCALVVRKNLIVLNVGDSRCYMLKNKQLIQLSEDQTYVNYLLKQGKIKKEDVATNPNRHVLTNSVGLYPTLSFDLKRYKYNGESLLVCSDGTYNNVSDVDLENILNTRQTCEQKVASIINLANYNGGSDNISLALWEILNDKN